NFFLRVPMVQVQQSDSFAFRVTQYRCRDRTALRCIVENYFVVGDGHRPAFRLSSFLKAISSRFRAASNRFSALPEARSTALPSFMVTRPALTAFIVSESARSKLRVVAFVMRSKRAINFFASLLVISFPSCCRK